jgi:hypothetical protein
MRSLIFSLILVSGFAGSSRVAGADLSGLPENTFPPALETYADTELTDVGAVLSNRVVREPFNLIATTLFLCAVLHTFLSHQFLHWAHLVEERYRRSLGAETIGQSRAAAAVPQTSALARLLHFLGEVEAVFGIWVVPLCVLMTIRLGWPLTLNYLERRVSYNEPVFVVVIMVMASTRPILGLAEQCLRSFASLGGGKPAAWWLVILTLGPLLGSLITEPAAMTISAILLARQFYALQPTVPLAYATLGLLFVNVSVGGVLTHFAAPPVLMVAAPWGWNTAYMFRHFGWIALLGICLGTAAYYGVFWRRFSELRSPAEELGSVGDGTVPTVPVWVTLGHLLFMGWAVINAHHPVLVIGGFLFFLAFFEVTKEYQTELQLRGPILVGFFLAGLVVHGGLQQWWIGPVLSRLQAVPLMLAAVGLTAFNDNAAITYLSTLVPNLADHLKYAVVAGAVTGGGLTVIANAPNPAGQSVLGRFFKEGIAPLGLLAGALPATFILVLCFLFFG